MSDTFQINYYVGPMLAEAGELQLEDHQILFKPTGPIERAMGAKDVVIPLDKIVIFDSTGGLSRTVRIKAAEKIHKFEGSEAARLKDWLLKKLPDKVYQRPSGVKLLHPTIAPKYSCPQCTEILQPGFKYCTLCGARPSPICHSCQCLIDSNWTICGYCGVKITLPSV